MSDASDMLAVADTRGKLADATEKMERLAAEWLELKAAGRTLTIERELTEAEQNVRRLGRKLRQHEGRR